MENPRSARYANLLPIAELATIDKRLNPFPIYKQLREHTPVRYDERRQAWDVFRYEDAQRILKDTAVFSSRRSIAGGENESILTLDPPRHTQLRAIVNKAFTPKVVADLEPKIASINQGLLDEVKDNGSMDLVEDLAVPLPVIVIAELLGVPPKDRRLFKTWSDVLVKGARENTEAAFLEVMAEKKQALVELQTYFTQILEQRRQAPKEDLITMLLNAEVEGEKLSDEEILAFAILLLAAGNETTTNLITNAVRRLTEEPPLQPMLRGHPEQVPEFIEEVLRYYSPIQAIGRVAVQDVTIGSHLIKAGERVVAWVGSANRDEAKFPEAERFIPDRKPNPHMAFGFGVHFCLGAPLARLEGQVAMREILKHFGNLALVQGTKLETIQSSFVFGVKQFPVTFQPL